MRWFLPLVVAVSCGTPTRTTSAPPSQPPSAVAAPPSRHTAIVPAEDAAVAVDAAPYAAAPVDASRPRLKGTYVLPANEPQIAGKHYVLTEGKPVRLANGTTLTWLGEGYHRARRLYGSPYVPVTIVRGKQRVEADVSTKREVEVDAFGTTLVLGLDDAEIDITVVGPTRKPPSEDKIRALIEERVVSEKLPTPGSLWGRSDGFVIYSVYGPDLEQLWEARFGLYTRRLIFSELPPLHPCEANPLAKGCY